MWKWFSLFGTFSETVCSLFFGHYFPERRFVWKPFAEASFSIKRAMAAVIKDDRNFMVGGVRNFGQNIAFYGQNYTNVWKWRERRVKIPNFSDFFNKLRHKGGKGCILNIHGEGSRKFILSQEREKIKNSYL